MKIFAPAKLNIFLKVLGRRLDDYHIIRSGITFIDLYDVVKINISNKMCIRYKGPFRPKGDTYDDCIILKTLKFLNLNKSLNLDLTITKNIPVQGGLGSASTNAAALIKGLEAMKLIIKKKPNFYTMLGADIPCFLFQKNCLVTGIGEIIHRQTFPKYYFLLVKPNFDNSTKDIYNKLDYDAGSYGRTSAYQKIQINIEDTGNDFEKIVFKENSEFREIIEFLESLDRVIFSRMTGTGSCCYAVFEKKESALEANVIFKSNFPDLWSCVCENNTMNN